LPVTGNQVDLMRKPDLTVPELIFVVVTRALLAAGVGLLLAGRLSDKQRRMIGATLVAIGAVTTVPALMAVIGSRDRES
jgi:MFS family permease